jgi:hypothetical protein
MRTHLIALAAALSIVGLAGVSVAGANPPSGGGGGGVSSGGGGHAGGGGGGGSHGGGGGFHGGGGGHFAGGGFRGGGFRGGSGGGRAASSNFMARGGYVSHGSRGYHFVGYQSAGLRGFSAAPRVGHASRISLALGPRMGSAATAARVDHLSRVAHLSRVDHLGGGPGHRGHPVHGKRHPKLYSQYNSGRYDHEYLQRPPLFCDSAAYYPTTMNPTPPFNPCRPPIKVKSASAF